MWFYEIRGEAGRKDAETAAKRLFPGVEASAVEQIELTTSDGQRARLERQTGEWRVVEPLAAPGGWLRRRRDRFGADAARERVGLREAAAARRLRPGRRRSGPALPRAAAPTTCCVSAARRRSAATLYAWVEGKSSVYAVSGIAVNALTKSLDELREKRILRFDVGSVEGITLRWPAGHLVLSRSDAGWRLAEPLAGPADETTVDELLNDLSFLRASGFVDAPTPAQERALEPPELAVELTLKAGEQGRGGGPAPPRDRRARRRRGRSSGARGAAPACSRSPPSVSRISSARSTATASASSRASISIWPSAWRSRSSRRAQRR